MSTYDRLRDVRKDLPWRIGLAAKNHDHEAVEVFTKLTDAIDAALKFHDQRELVGEPDHPEAQE